MLLQRIMLQNFRNYEQGVFDIHPLLTLIIGPNTRGKTSLLEGIYTTIYGEGFRESKEEELIKWEKDLCNVAAIYQEPNGETSQFQAMLRRLSEKVEKAYFINKTKKTHYSFLQYQTRAVLFTPDNIEIITGSPSERRTYVNKILSSTDQDYKKKLQNYENALRKRNKLLESYRSEETLKEELTFWNDYLVQQATYITQQRKAYCDYLNERQTLDIKHFDIVYQSNEMTIERLQERYELDKKIRKTTIGPQKDDFELYIGDGDERKNVQMYGSRSEQRLSMFWLKLNEIRFIEEKVKKKPLLLLDDVFSELDDTNKALVMRLIHEYQTVLTSTEQELIELTDIEKSVIEL